MIVADFRFTTIRANDKSSLAQQHSSQVHIIRIILRTSHIIHIVTELGTGSQTAVSVLRWQMIPQEKVLQVERTALQIDYPCSLLS